MFFLSTTPFCCGFLGTNNYLFNAFYSKDSLSSLELNPPPLSNLRHFNFNPVFASTIALKIMKFYRASYFSIKKVTHIILEYSSINNMKYLSPCKLLTLEGPHKSIYTRFNNPFE
jgi:hypothetical protein